MIQKSDLWEEIVDKYFLDGGSLELINDFREPNSINSRLAGWSPTDNSSRQFKFLLWNVVERMHLDCFSYIKKIKNRTLGNPTTIRYNGVDIDLDYLLAADELLFLETENNILSNAKSVVEIGAGFGRTPHAILENFDNIEKYTIIDLPEVLQLSKRYLEMVIPDKISLIQFVNAFDDYKLEKTDLFININSFQEMERQTIMEYYERVIKHCHHVYIKNPVGKYDPEEFHIQQNLRSDKPFNLGLCSTMYTVCDQEAHKEMVKDYVKNYSFDTLTVQSHRRCALLHFYHHVLYENK